ncbi:uncharacterized protein PV09_05180 [Verruconis gallopava]|uniref:UBC core domain-containing protein n=1 Tax=Verruconis gallopava TaxID=253628 RepID=A0A0D1YTB7_9PEZI|nr:uncharacterized protein PV09_05180 [Verruconis gallopava]KIW03887.1 hypothetical protein PV09_05180 [Verruconis gallopava]
MSSRSKETRTTSKRLIQELKDYQKDPNEALLYLGPASDNELMEWTAVMKGVEGTAYEGGRWLLHILIPSNYPLSPPTITFSTPICHPNVHFKTGEICLDLLKTSWSPAYTISSTLTAVHQLLTSAEPNSPLNIDVAVLLREHDLAGANSLIRYYTRVFRYDGDLGG